MGLRNGWKRNYYNSPVKDAVLASAKNKIAEREVKHIFAVRFIFIKQDTRIFLLLCEKLSLTSDKINVLCVLQIRRRFRILLSRSKRTQNLRKPSIPRDIRTYTIRVVDLQNFESTDDERTNVYVPTYRMCIADTIRVTYLFAGPDDVRFRCRSINGSRETRANVFITRHFPPRLRNTNR